MIKLYFHLICFCLCPRDIWKTSSSWRNQNIAMKYFGKILTKFFIWFNKLCLKIKLKRIILIQWSISLIISVTSSKTKKRNSFFGTFFSNSLIRCFDPTFMTKAYRVTCSWTVWQSPFSWHWARNNLRKKFSSSTVSSSRRRTEPKGFALSSQTSLLWFSSSGVTMFRESWTFQSKSFCPYSKIQQDIRMTVFTIFGKTLNILWTIF